MNDVVLELRNINVQYSGIKALDDFNISMERGKCYCLCGENGSGRTTLAKVVTGVEKPNSGAKYFVNNRQIYKWSPKIAHSFGIGINYQDLALFPNLTVKENISFSDFLGSKGFMLKKNKSIPRIKQLFSALGVSLDLDQKVKLLALVEQQITAICRALYANPQILVFDESTSALNRNEVKYFLKIINNLKKKGISILFISNKPDEVFEVADTIIIIRDGKKIGSYRAKELSASKLSKLMTGKILLIDKLDKPASGELLLDVRNLYRKHSFSDISFKLHKGEVISVTGLMSSGRSEIALCLFGINKPDSGKIFFEGEELQLKNQRDAVKKGISYVPEQRISRGIIMNKSVEANIILTMLDDISNNFGIINTPKKQRIVIEWINNLHIHTASPAELAESLSGGNQQKIVIAKWIASNPKVLILDQPTSGIDIASKNSIHELIKLLASRGIGIIIITDEIQECLICSHHILVMRKGEIVRSVHSADITEKELELTVYGR